MTGSWLCNQSYRSNKIKIHFKPWQGTGREPIICMVHWTGYVHRFTYLHWWCWPHILWTSCPVEKSVPSAQNRRRGVWACLLATHCEFVTSVILDASIPGADPGVGNPGLIPPYTVNEPFLFVLRTSSSTQIRLDNTFCTLTMATPWGQSFPPLCMFLDPPLHTAAQPNRRGRDSNLFSFRN